MSVSCHLLIACGFDSKDLSEHKLNTIENTTGKIIDSIYCDLDTDGNLDRISVINEIDSSRLLLVEIKKGSSYRIISSNKIIIGCNTCGYQSGDPFIGLTKKSNGFELNMEFVQYTFFYELGKMYLDEINILKTKQTENGIEENHEVYSHKKFGKINLYDLKEGFALKIINKKKSHDSITFIENALIDSTKLISFKEFQLIFTKFNKEFSMWYYPKLIVDNDTLKIMGLPIENGSEISIRKSSNGNYFVLDNIIKGYLEDDKGDNILHENYTCVIINVKEAKVEQFLQSECDGAWNDSNEWISSDNVIFSSE